MAVEPRSSVSPARVVGVCMWIGIIFALLFALGETRNDAQREVVIVASVANVVYGLTAFVRHGATRVTIVGLFNLASSIFLGGAGWYAAVTHDERVPVYYLGLAILAGFLLQVLVTSMAGTRVATANSGFLLDRDSAWAIRWGCGTLLALILVEQWGILPALSAWIEGTAVAATVVLAVGVLWRPNARLISFGALLIAVAFVLYATVFHSGTGRLRVIALAGAILLLVTLRFRRRAIKWLVLLITPVALSILAQHRLSLQEALAAGGAVGRNGLESMLVPVVIFGRLLQEQSDGGQLAWGLSLLSFPRSVLPETWFPGVPGALGYELVRIYSPERYGSGYSVAATVGAEAVYNFALPGLLIFAPLLAWLMVALDRGLVRAARRLSQKRTAIVALAFWAIFSGGIVDLAWNGQHVFLARTLSRLPLLIFLAVLAWLESIARSPRSTHDRPARPSVTIRPPRSKPLVPSN